MARCCRWMAAGCGRGDGCDGVSLAGKDTSMFCSCTNNIIRFDFGMEKVEKPCIDIRNLNY